jgi:copper chaperone NosL
MQAKIKDLFKRKSKAAPDFGWGAVGTGTLALLLLQLSAACGSTEIRPVGIFREDMCSRCKMAISEKRTAGEIILKDGTALKFDDLGCMASHDKGLVDKSVVAAYFVADFGSGAWIDAKDAYFVKSERITTPMSSGTVAFRDRAAAEVAAAKHEGQVLRFAGVFAE